MDKEIHIALPLSLVLENVFKQLSTLHHQATENRAELSVLREELEEAHELTNKAFAHVMGDAWKRFQFDLVESEENPQEPN